MKNTPSCAGDQDQRVEERCEFHPEDGLHFRRLPCRRAGSSSVFFFREFARTLLETLFGVPVEKIRLTKTGFRIED